MFRDNHNQADSSLPAGEKAKLEDTVFLAAGLALRFVYVVIRLCYDTCTISPVLHIISRLAFTGGGSEGKGSETAEAHGKEYWQR